MILFADRRQAGKELAERVVAHLAHHRPDDGSAPAAPGAATPAGTVPLEQNAQNGQNAQPGQNAESGQSGQPSPSADGSRADVLVLGLPRGGVPVAAEVANRLRAPLDAFTVRKLGAPRQPEFAIGAIATGGTRVVNPDALRQLGVSDDELAALVARERAELSRRERLYRHDRPFPVVADRTVIVVDDGLATGATMIAAARALRSARPARLIAAVPVASAQGMADLRREVDAAICLATPEPFLAVGFFYERFEATEDDEVRRLLADTSASA